MSKRSPKQPFPTYPMSPLVSVIIPVFNVVNQLERCLDSVLAQTYTNLEIILIDDGSTDGSEKLCDDLAPKDPRIKVIHQSNRGLSGARNTGLKAARGNYVTFVDSDDSTQPELIEILLRLCQVNYTDMSICSFQEIIGTAEPASASSPAVSAYSDTPADDNLTSADSDSPARDTSTSANSVSSARDAHVQSQSEKPDEKVGGQPSAHNIHAQPQALSETLNTLDCLTRMLCEDGFSMSAWGKLYARRLFAHVQFPESRLYEDVGTTYRLVMQCPKIAISPLPLYNYYINPGSITQQHFTLHKLDLIDLTDQMCDDITKWATTQPKSVQTHLAHLTTKRRMHARFSILRQMVMVTMPEPTTGSTSETHSQKTSPKNSSKSASLDTPYPALESVPALQGKTDQQSFLLTQNEIVQYLRTHKQDILQNPLASRRDKFAMYSLLLGLPVFRLSWRLYNHHKNHKILTSATQK